MKGIKKHSFIIAIILIFLIAIGTFKINYILVGKSQKIADNLFLKGEYKKSIKKYESLHEKREKNPIDYLKISNIYDIENKTDKSIQYKTRALNLNYKKYKDASNQLVYNEYFNGNYVKALKYGEEVLEKYPNDKNLIRQMIVLFNINGDKDRALKFLKEYKVDKKSANDLAEYGKMCIDLGFYDIGLSNLKKAYELDKNNIIVYDVLSQMSYLNQNYIEQKIKSNVDPSQNKEMYNLWLAKVYSSNKRYCKDALNLLNDKSLDKNGIMYNLIKLTAYSNLGDFDNCAKIIDKLKNEYKNDFRFNHYLGWYYFKKQDFKKAEKYCLKSIKENPLYNDNYSYLMPQILIKKHEYNSAMAYYVKALYNEPFNFKIASNIGYYFWNVRKNFNMSSKFYDLASKINKYNTEVKYDMALVYLDNENPDSASKLLNECISLEPNVNKYYRTLSIIYLNKGKSQEAFNNLNKAIENDKNDFLTLNDLGVYYVLNNDSLDKGFEVITKAYEGVKNSNLYEKYTIDTISKNYNKIKEVYEKYKNENIKSMEAPELTLIY